MPSEQLVSAIVAVFNGERYLAEALESALDQTHPALELIVVDDGSSDSSLEIARNFEPRARCIEAEHGGVAAARNRGVELASGEFLAFLDSDDVWEPDRLEVQLAEFAADPGLDLVFGHEVAFKSPELPPDVAARIACPPGSRPAYMGNTMLARRPGWDRVGPLDTEVAVGEFLDWLLRARAAGLRESMLARAVLRRRLHGRNMTLLRRAESSDYAKILKRSLDRRRAKGEA